MKKILLITAMLAATCVGTASAQFPGLSVGQPDGINLSWTQCDASLGNAGLNMAPTCVSNTAFSATVPAQSNVQRLMMASFIYPAGFTSLGATDMLVDLATDGATVNCWWNFVLSNTFRASAISMNFNSDTDGNCGNYWITLPSGVGVFGFSRSPYYNDACKLRLDLTAAASADEAAAAPQPAPGDEIHNFTLRITPASSTSSTGPANATCQGCLRPACIRFQQTVLYRSDGPSHTIISASSRQYVTWQGGNPVCRPGICDVPVPVKNKTWGSLKTLYR